jgi:putative oxidoreductase
MAVLFHIGRILLVAGFLWSGLGKLIDIAGTAQMIIAEVTLPALLSESATQLEAAVGMAWPRLLAIAAALVQVIGAVMIMFNIGTRWAALMLLLYTIGATYVLHDFWTMLGTERMNGMILAFKNLALVGAFLMLFVLGSWRPPAMPRPG